MATKMRGGHASSIINRRPARRNRDGGPSDTGGDPSESREAEQTRLSEILGGPSAPSRGSLPSASDYPAFSSMPLSRETVGGLSDAGYSVPTPVQAACILHGLCGRDVLGACRTGGGKTLAFVVPLLEALWRDDFGTCAEDGVGGLIVSPTRELAVQIFQTLRTVGARHACLSAGCVTGGKREFLSEQERIGRTNVLVCTPGRLLQHLEQTPAFEHAVAHVRVLVLDEADRLLDLGFRGQIDGILGYLPAERQTLLFSATQTKKVGDLARLSLHRPEYIAVDDNSAVLRQLVASDGKATDGERDTSDTVVCPTPSKLAQSYLVCKLPQKLDVLFSFLRSHLKCKTIAFFSSCSQVRYIHEVLCKMQPGVPVAALHGKVKQARRTRIYFDFMHKRGGSLLLATDVAARGLHFPEVDWVVQMDAPENLEMYVHRVGRTARHTNAGKALLCLLPSEQEGVVAWLQQAHVPVKKLSVNPRHAVSVSTRAASLVAQSPETHALAKKAFRSYLRSVMLMPDKGTFDVRKLPIEAYAESLGLPAAPSTRFLGRAKEGEGPSGEDARDDLRHKKNKNRKLQRLKEQIKAEKLQRKLERTGGVAADTAPDVSDDDGGGGLLLVKKRHAPGDDGADDATPAVLPDDRTARAGREACAAKKIRLHGTSANTRTVFDDDGAERPSLLSVGDAPAAAPEALVASRAEYLATVRARLGANAERDKVDERERVRERRRK
eukprot:CAMPEP_0194266234 /NCGR_PEP_ID=MMETSP0169-20130528/1203_1 /TAXON_ID=218684 /ORGANISM="Corethron pennatum, Strain L29A3" /LENGTH=723 /DNA_ID=CAMNT_0039006867 /DNA_START=46 /DNA_END=2214 /DNA_ORIENTATION=-